MLCQILRSYTSNICSQRRQVYYFYCVHFLCCLFGFVLFYFLSLSFCSLLVHFPLVVWVSIFFVYVNTSLQQSTCIMFTSHLVGFALSCCLLLLSCCLLDHFPHFCLGFQLFCFFKHFFATIHLFLENG